MPNTPYGESKLMAEQVIRAHAKWVCPWGPPGNKGQCTGRRLLTAKNNLHAEHLQASKPSSCVISTCTGLTQRAD